MMRSLFSGVSGLRNHLVQMDVIGNNISNVNTIAFKASRVSFQDLLSQTLRAAGGPAGGRGGINAQQVGLGMRVGSIDTIFTQGNLLATQRKTDLAIQGDGLFILSDGLNQYYARAGAFDFDIDGNLVNPSNGYIVQGYVAAGGVLGKVLGNVQTDFAEQLPASVTTEVGFVGNLDSAATSTSASSSTLLSKLFDVDGNPMNLQIGDDITITGTAITPAAGTTLLTALRDSSGTSLGITALDVVTYDAEIPAGADWTKTFTGDVQDTSTLEDLRADLETELALESTGTTVSLTSTGKFKITAGAKDIDDLTVVDTNQTKTLFTFDDIAAGATVESTQFVSSAAAVSISDTYEITASSSLSDLATALQTAVRTATSGTETVTVQSDGSLLITSGAENLTDLALTISGKTDYNAYGLFDTLIAAGENGQTAEGCRTADYTTFVTAYDSLGDPQILTLLFAKNTATGVSNTWKWQALVPYKSGDYPSGDTGTLTFNADGSLATGGSAQITFDPDGTGGVDELTINFGFGTADEFDGVTQFSSPFTVTLKDQDGYGSGTLDDISIDDAGIVTGVFTNGVNQTLAQIALASFANPAGLYKAGDNLYRQSLNSGLPQVGDPGTGGRGTISPSSLEMSNVDLAQSFTEIITAQRGFQVNARVITTSDEILQELVNLKR